MRLTLAEWIKDQRLARGLRQEDLAEEIGVTRSAVGNWEIDMQSPSESHVVELARVFDVTSAEIEAMITRAPRGRPTTSSQRGRRPVGRSGKEVAVRVHGRVPCDAVRWMNPEETWEPVMVPAEWLRGRSVDDVFAVEVSGDCLAALKIEHGDILICAWRGSRRPVDGDLVVVRIEGDVTCKRWFWSGDQIELRDGDDQVTHRAAPTDNIHIEGYVLHAIRTYER